MESDSEASNECVTMKISTIIQEHKLMISSKILFTSELRKKTALWMPI